MSEHFFPIKLQLRIDWSELDYFGHVNNVSFFKYAQAARVNYWETVGINTMHRETNVGPMLASCKCDFKLPLFFPGQVTVHSRVEFIKNTSFGIHHHLINDKGEVVAEAHDVMVMFDFGSNEKVNFPKEIRDRIEELENRKFN
ncbi:MAG: acyl-CoA thioesterase [Bacteroidota bacterium]